MIKMILSFVTFNSTVTLNQTRFSHPLLERHVVTIRGATAPDNIGTFRWSSGVRALSLLLTKQAVVSEARRNGLKDEYDPAAIHGGDNSLAASLDYAISKQPLWLQDMFGTTPQGTLISKLLFRRMNPDRKRPGPVTVFIANVDFDVRVAVDGVELREDAYLRRLEAHLTQGSVAPQFVKAY
jgi:hypothetical protein